MNRTEPCGDVKYPDVESHQEVKTQGNSTAGVNPIKDPSPAAKRRGRRTLKGKPQSRKKAPPTGGSRGKGKSGTGPNGKRHKNPTGVPASTPETSDSNTSLSSLSPLEKAILDLPETPSSYDAVPTRAALPPKGGNSSGKGSSRGANNPRASGPASSGKGKGQPHEDKPKGDAHKPLPPARQNDSRAPYLQYMSHYDYVDPLPFAVRRVTAPGRAVHVKNLPLLACAHYAATRAGVRVSFDDPLLQKLQLVHPQVVPPTSNPQRTISIAEFGYSTVGPLVLGPVTYAPDGMIEYDGALERVQNLSVLKAVTCTIRVGPIVYEPFDLSEKGWWDAKVFYPEGGVEALAEEALKKLPNIQPTSAGYDTIERTVFAVANGKLDKTDRIHSLKQIHEAVKIAQARVASKPEFDRHSSENALRARHVVAARANRLVPRLSCCERLRHWLDPMVLWLGGWEYPSFGSLASPIDYGVFYTFSAVIAIAGIVSACFLAPTIAVPTVSSVIGFIGTLLLVMFVYRRRGRFKTLSARMGFYWWKPPFYETIQPISGEAPLNFTPGEYEVREPYVPVRPKLNTVARIGPRISAFVPFCFRDDQPTYEAAMMRATRIGFDITASRAFVEPHMPAITEKLFGKSALLCMPHVDQWYGVDEWLAACNSSKSRIAAFKRVIEEDSKAPPDERRLRRDVSLGGFMPKFELTSRFIGIAHENGEVGRRTDKLPRAIIISSPRKNVYCGPMFKSISAALKTYMGPMAIVPGGGSKTDPFNKFLYLPGATPTDMHVSGLTQEIWDAPAVTSADYGQFDNIQPEFISALADELVWRMVTSSEFYGLSIDIDELHCSPRQAMQLYRDTKSFRTECKKFGSKPWMVADLKHARMTGGPETTVMNTILNWVFMVIAVVINEARGCPTWKYISRHIGSGDDTLIMWNVGKDKAEALAAQIFGVLKLMGPILDGETTIGKHAEVLSSIIIPCKRKGKDSLTWVGLPGRAMVKAGWLLTSTVPRAEHAAAKSASAWENLHLVPYGRHLARAMVEEHGYGVPDRGYGSEFRWGEECVEDERKKGGVPFSSNLTYSPLALEHLSARYGYHVDHAHEASFADLACDAQIDDTLIVKMVEKDIGLIDEKCTRDAHGLPAGDPHQA